MSSCLYDVSDYAAEDDLVVAVLAKPRDYAQLLDKIGKHIGVPNHSARLRKICFLLQATSNCPTSRA